MGRKRPTPERDRRPAGLLDAKRGTMFAGQRGLRSALAGPEAGLLPQLLGC